MCIPMQRKTRSGVGSEQGIGTFVIVMRISLMDENIYPLLLCTPYSATLGLAAGCERESHRHRHLTQQISLW